jgi:hypothetical protein
MGLGMACGLGSLGVAGLGTAFLALCLVLLRNLGERPDRCMKVALVSSGPVFPRDHVEGVFARHRITLEPIELTNGEAAIMRYRARLARDCPLDELSAQLMNGGTAGIKSVSWETSRKQA